MKRSPFKCFLIGSEALLISCGELLLERGHEILGVISGSSAIISWCGEKGLRVIPSDSDYSRELAEEPFDYLLSITHLKRVPSRALALARQGAFNFHDGPLPRHAGLFAPAWAIMAGEREYGISWHLMTERFDEGDVVLQRTFPIAHDETGLTLNTTCFQAGIETFPELVDLLESGTPPLVRLPLDQHTVHRSGDRPRGLALLDLSQEASDLGAMVRALDYGAYENPLARPRLLGTKGTVLIGSLSGIVDPTSEPGTIERADGGELQVSAKNGSLRLIGLTTEDGGPLTAAEAVEHLGVQVGGMLPRSDSALLERVDGFAKSAARYEAAWAERLESLNPVELPYVNRLTTQGVTRRSLALAASPDRDALVAAFVRFVARLSGRERFDLAYREEGAVGAPRELESFVAARVPMRAKLEATATISEANAAVARELAWLRERVGFARDLTGRLPTLNALRGRQFFLPVGIELVERLDARPVAEGDFVLVVARDGTACLDFDASVLDPSRVASMVEHFEAALSSDASRPWTETPLLTPGERRLVLEQWATSARPGVAGTCVHSLIEAQVARTPDAVAVAFEDTVLTYRELDSRANQLAHHLRDLGAGPDTLVALCCERSLDMMIAILGIHKAGAAYVPMDPTYPGDRIAYMIEDAQAQILVTQESVLGEIPENRSHVVCVDRDWQEISKGPATPPVTDVSPANLAYCIYTSGSTGRPKGVMVEHRNVVNFFAAMDERLGTDPGAWLAVTSLSFDISVLELLWTLTHGSKVVIYADENLAAGAAARLPNAHKGVGFSLFYFSANEGEDEGDRYRVLMEGAKFGDKHGFTAVWTPERHFHAFGGLYPNPAVTGAAIAAVTSRIGVRAGSCVLPLHHPVRVVEEWSVVDNLSHGRVGVSFAAGWQPNDFIFQPQNYGDSKNKTLEMIETVRRLWRGETLTFPGPRGDVPVRTLPPPVQEELPIWFTTAGNPESYELAGKIGANVLTHLLGQSIEELADKITLYRRAWKAAGHKGEGEVSLMLHTFVGDSDAEVKELVRAPMKAYLGTSISLIKGYAAAFPTFKKGPDGKTPELDFNSLTPEEMDALLDYSFERYHETSGLFGTVETCAKVVDRLKGIGVDDIACLIDFGVDTDRVLRHLKHLNRLRALVSRPRAVFTDNSFAALMARHRVTHLQCTPSMAGMLVADDRNRDALRGLRTMCVGGEAFPPALARELQRLVPGDIHNMYGPTETTIWSTMHTLAGDAESVPLGTPLANNEVYVLDALRQPVPPGVAGELYIGGAQVVRGYWRRPELSAERFGPHPFSRDPAARLYRTGDLVRWSENGTLEFLGRVDFQVKVRGYRIELGEIEAVIAGYPEVREAVVMARDDAHDGDTRLVAYLTWRTPNENGVAALREYVRESLPEFMVPSHFVVLRDLPRTPNQKVDRKALPSMVEIAAAAPRSEAPQVAPAGDLEKVIAGVWEEVLKLPSVGVQDNFFDLGGHSLLAVQVHSRLKVALERDLSITDLFRFPTVRGLAAFLGGDSNGVALKSGLDRAAQRREMAARRAQRPTK